MRGIIIELTEGAAIVNHIVRLDDLLGATELLASFHDALLLAFQVDYKTRSLTAEFDICVGDPAAEDRSLRERCRRGKLYVSGLILWAIEPPEGMPSHRESTPWLTSDGLLEEAPTEEGKRLARNLGDDLIA